MYLYPWKICHVVGYVCVWHKWYHALISSPMRFQLNLYSPGTPSLTLTASSPLLVPTQRKAFVPLHIGLFMMTCSRITFITHLSMPGTAPCASLCHPQNSSEINALIIWGTESLCNQPRSHSYSERTLRLNTQAIWLQRRPFYLKAIASQV